MSFDYDSPEQQLRLAAKSGDIVAVGALLNQGVNIDAAPSFGMTAVQLALKYGHLDIVRLLLQHGAAISLNKAETPEQLRFLQENGVNDNDTPLKRSAVEQRSLRAYERGTLSWEEMQVALGKMPDPSLVRQTTFQEVEEKHFSPGGPFDYRGVRWGMFKARMQPGDELWEFDYGQLASRGYKLVRSGRVIAKFETGR